MADDTPAYEPDLFAAWSDAQLLGDGDFVALAVGGIHEQVAPPKTPRPYVVRVLAGGPGRLYSEGVRRVWFDGLWYLTVYVDQNDRATLAAIIKRMDARLHRASGPVDGGEVLLCVQEGAPIPSPPLATGGALITAVAVPYSAQVIADS